MIRWIKKKLGILQVERTMAQHTADIRRLEKKVRIGKRPMRYDEIERARKRRYKKSA